MTIYTYMDVSTGNITEKDNALLQQPESAEGSTVLPHPYGFWVHVVTEPEELKQTLNRLRNHGYSLSFQRLYRMAHSRKCLWLNIDRDGDLEPGLPAFNW